MGSLKHDTLKILKNIILLVKQQFGTLFITLAFPSDAKSSSQNKTFRKSFNSTNLRRETTLRLMRIFRGIKFLRPLVGLTSIQLKTPVAQAASAKKKKKYL